VVHDFRFHRSRAAERFVDTAEVVESEPEGYGCPMVLPLFTEGVRQSGESPRPHADAEIASFND
jgi:hypothetical protein